MPLVLRGARQVGKTQSVRELGKRQFSSFLEFNFERQPDLATVFESDLNPKRIIRDLEVLGNQKVNIQESLLFFDEIQACPKALMSLRYFREELPQLRVIAAGSLLEFVIGTIPFPVGRVSFEYIYPMSFFEFLNATDRAAVTEMLPRFSGVLKETHEIPLAILHKIDQGLREYFIVGGMPRVVSEYRKSGSFRHIGQIQDDLLESFVSDIQKYANGKQQFSNCSQILPRIFRYIGNQINYTKLGEGDDVKRTKRSLELLAQAMIIHWVRSVHPGGLPLGAEASGKHFKCLFLDIGLGQRLSGISPAEVIKSADLLKTYEGRLAEQFVGQQLLAESETASEGRKLYCWIRGEKSSTAEVDYLIVRDGKIYPVEVKSGKSGSLKSLHLFLEKFGGTGLCLQNIRQITNHEKLTFLPLATVL